MLFLLDGLQEDLNRIQQKPYIEKPDSTDEMVHDKKALQDMADTCWEIYKKRNDSVITDLFAGMYKSTLVCPECDKVSIVFDPFTNLTLQLPIENLWSRVIYFFPLYQPPIKIDVDIDKHATFFNLKEYIGNKTGVDPKKMVISEIYKCKFFKMFDDKLALANENLAENDMICIFELDMVPTNYPAPKKKAQKIRSLLNYNNSDEEEDVPEGDSALAERMLVPVFHRAQKPAGARSQHRQLFGNPSYIVLTRDEAQDEDSILRKALENAQALTTLNILTEKGDESDDAGSDTVIMNPEDANSSPGSKVQASSVQSEDGMVDISMPDAAKSASLHVSYPADTDPESRKPRRLKPGSFILPASRQLFEMKYMKGSEMIPTGWNALHDDTKDFPLLSSRLPQPERRRRAKPHGSSAAEKLKRRIANSGSGSDSSDGETDDPPPPAVPQPSAAMSHDGGDSSEDDGFPEVEELVNSSNKGFGRFDRSTPRNKFGLITYGRKAKAKAPQRFAGEDDDMQDDEETSAKVPLIRLGEALILDWKIDLDNSLFQSPRFRHFEDDGGFRGFNTWDNVPLLPDEELVTKRMHRAARRKDGVTLEDCLDEYNKAEILSKDDAWYCPRCKEHRRASKKLELWKVPDILVIHLKRFSAHGRFRDKLDLFVEFPVEGLGLTSRVAVNEDGKELIYDLFAVDNHYGGLGGGHYTAYAKNMVDEQWYDYNGMLFLS